MRGKNPAQAPVKGRSPRCARGSYSEELVKDVVDFHAVQPSELAKSIVVKVTGLSNESTAFNFYIGSSDDVELPVDEAKMSS